MLVDEATILVKAGNGGNGAVNFKRDAKTAKGGPDGGNGGNGGNVYAQGVNDITALMEFRYKKNVRAENGINGGRQNSYGRNGKDIIIFLPLGIRVTDTKTNEGFEIDNTTEKILIAKGGKGGKGNNEFKTATNQTPFYAQKGEPGEEKKLHLELKIIADVGLIGLPNSGKSSLLSVLTNAHPKIGDYPFTTLKPNLGVMDGLIVADIPGLIRGASTGKGLGDKFLRHIEKTRMLIHCIDVQSSELTRDYTTVRDELGSYNKSLLKKEEMILLTKSDLLEKEQIENKLKVIRKVNKNSFSISIYDEDGIMSLKKIISDIK